MFRDCVDTEKKRGRGVKTLGYLLKSFEIVSGGEKGVFLVQCERGLHRFIHTCIDVLLFPCHLVCERPTLKDKALRFTMNDLKKKIRLESLKRIRLFYL